ncbi:uncharacterized protein LOC116296797 isoform X2 [Actinia tenebrosa]|uniref:Uncharacterized protein LOC116296797 isoform X2 n=1 Tax=Actinia tenebrosa TaxID=6105 RepID=A0A6P8I6T9_ACTTE|nr:uncharacterized protein LOC116296797 isoform X2 [Actinia tenebrosa]
MLAQQCFVLLLLLIMFLRDGEAWMRRRRRRRAPPPCHARDCQLSEWSHWSVCLHRCGNAETRYRTRTKTADEACGGTCYYNFREESNCNMYPCQNGGTPSYGQCSCRTGYTGTCCELMSERKPKGKENPTRSQESNDKKCSIGCELGIAFGCCAVLFGISGIGYYVRKKWKLQEDQVQSVTFVRNLTVERKDGTITVTEQHVKEHLLVF